MFRDYVNKPLNVSLGFQLVARIQRSRPNAFSLCDITQLGDALERK